MTNPTDKSSADDGREYVIQSHIVCYMDLLEQSKRLKEWPPLPKDGRPTPEMIEAAQKTIGAVRHFRDEFEDFMAAFEKIGVTDEELGVLAPEHRTQFLRIREADRTTQYFSDASVFYAPEFNSHGDRNGAALNSILGAAAFGLLKGLARGDPFRGGIAVDLGTEMDPGNFYGPALAGAYEMESKFAEYPRVVLSKEAVDLAHRKSGFSEDPEIERRLVQLHQSPPDLICTDADGMTIVDFMGEGVKSSFMPGLLTLPEMVSQAYEFAKAEAFTFEAKGNVKLSRRYHQLLHYMRSRLPIWGINP